MKKRNLKSLRINKEKISTLAVVNSIYGGSWICTGTTCRTCPWVAQTNEGPCPGGTSGCHIP